MSRPADASCCYSRRTRLGMIGTAQITPPLPRFGYLYAADQKTSFLRGFLRFGMGAPTTPVPAATFRVLFVLVILSHDRRRILHLNVTEHPTAAWTARQLLEACATDDAPRFVVRDRDAIYGDKFRRQVAALKIQELLTAPRSPWQNAYA